MKNFLSKIIKFISWRFFESYFIQKRFNLIEQYKEDTLKESYNYFKKHFQNSMMFKTSKNLNSSYSIELFNYSINKIELNKLKNGLCLEFGTYKGQSAEIICKIPSKRDNNLKLYSFDSFEGLTEDWLGSEKTSGTFKLEKPPKLPNNCDLVEGNIYKTLKNFLKKQDSKISFIHCDVDTYEITKFILAECKNYLNNQSIIIFDDLHNRAGWKNGQIKALEEIFPDNFYEFIAFSESGQATIIIK